MNEVKGDEGKERNIEEVERKKSKLFIQNQY